MTRVRPVDRVTRVLACASMLLGAIGAANAQTDPPAAGPAAPTAETGEPPQTPAQATAPDPAADGFKIGGFVFKPGGRIKLDIIRDFKPIGNEDVFDIRTIPLDGSEGGNSSLHARETRLFLDVRGPVEGRELRMYVETDFFGSGNALRLRHAFGSYGGLLAGQNWSTFVDESNIPNTIDLESPMAYPFIRQAQLRWTQKLSTKVTWSTALEDNRSTIQPPAGVPGKAEFPFPDVVTRLRYDGARWHAVAAGFVGWGRFRPVDGDPDDVTLWGLMLSGRVKTVGRDYLYSVVTLGEGVGRYRGGPTAVPDASGTLQPIPLTAFLAGYEHFWSPRLSSNAVFSQAWSREKDYYPREFNEYLGYAAVNLLYWFLPDRAWAGVEYLHGRRRVFSGQAGNADRLQFAVRFHLPS